jgi:hypothetical protein
MLGIPAGSWAACLSDTRTLSFDTWCIVWAKYRPARVPEPVWLNTARAMYQVGPMAYYMATHAN